MLTNFIWLLAERGWRVALGLGVGVLVMRHLGPAEYGVLGFALSLSAIFATVVSFGIDDVLVRELARRPEAARAVLRAGFRIKSVGAVAAFLLAAGSAWLLRPDDLVTLVLVGWVAAGLLFTPADVVESWYYARERMRPPSLARQAAIVIVALVRIGLVLGDAPLWAFAAASAGEAFLVSIGFFGLWRRAAVPQSRADDAVEVVRVTRLLLRQGAPLLLSGFLVMLSFHCDRLLLLHLAGEVEAGLYAAVARLTDLMHVIPVAIGAVFAPQMAALNSNDFDGKARMARRAAACMLGATVPVAAVVSGFAPIVVPFLLGVEYNDTSLIWRVQIWTLVFISLVSLRSRLWIVEGRTGWILIISAVTTFLNILLNLLLIPRWGAIGAAWAGVASWVISALVLPWIVPGAASSLLRWCGLAKRD